MEEEVHASDGCGGEVLLLAEELSEHQAVVTTCLADVLHGLEQHATSTASWVIDGLARFRVEDADHELHDRTGRVELTGFLVGEVGELLDEVLVGITEHVVGHGCVRQAHAREVVNEVDQQSIGQAVLVRPLDVTEDAVEGVRVRLLDFAHSPLDGLADVGGARLQVRPVAALRNLEPVLFGQRRVLFVSSGLIERLDPLFVVDVTDSLEEQQREDVGLEVGGVDGAAQDVGCIPQPRLDGPL